MPDSEISPRAARRLRGSLGHRHPADDNSARPDDRLSAAPPTSVSPPPPPFAQAAAPTPPSEPTSLAPGSIWGPQFTAGSPTSPTATPPPPRPADASAPEEATRNRLERPNPKHRRRAGEGPPDPDSVSINAEDSHAWWAQRDELDHLVRPKKRGAAARAERAAREAFAPAGAENYAPPLQDQEPTHNYSWDPSDVYTWGDKTRSATYDEPPSHQTGTDFPRQDQTPWDLLGLTSEATWSEVTKRHRQLAKQHHPDRHADQGEQARAAAEQRMSEINAAFGDLRKIYRLTDDI